MKFDLSLQQYVEWEVKNVMPIKGNLNGLSRNPGLRQKKKPMQPVIKR